MIQKLELYKKPLDWSPGRSFFIRILWVMFFKLLVNSFIPGTAWRKFILRIFGAKIGKGGKLKPNIKITFPWRLIIGDYCWIGENVWIDNLALVSIGNRVCISQKVYICTGNHNFRIETFPLSLGPVYIKDNVWIAAASSIAPNTIIENDAVVLMRSHVRGNIPMKSIIGGNPAIKIGER